MSKTILIVDDSRVSRMMARAYIEEQQPEWKILEASNGSDAIAMVEKEKIDVVTLDVNMPGMSGLEAGERILRVKPGILIAVLTANIQSSVVARAESLGMRFLQKPITEDTIGRLVEWVSA